MVPGTSSSDSDQLSLLKDFLALTGHPTVIVRLSQSHDSVTAHILWYTNPAYTAWSIQYDTNKESFRNWAVNDSIWHSVSDVRKPTSISYGNTNWTAYVVQQWGILQSQDSDHGPSVPTLDDIERLERPRKRRRTNSSYDTSTLSSRTMGPSHPTLSCSASPNLPNISQEEDLNILVDWTCYDLPPSSPYIEFLRSFDWSKTIIGPMQSW